MLREKQGAFLMIAGGLLAGVFESLHPRWVELKTFLGESKKRTARCVGFKGRRQHATRGMRCGSDSIFGEHKNALSPVVCFPCRGEGSNSTANNQKVQG